jgi:hypothetical protein
MQLEIPQNQASRLHNLRNMKITLQEQIKVFAQADMLFLAI